ncbi:hypothetical protein AGMMS50225_24710 [Betaproteobacteria bacterium]|nr:hypothetical protein AGMMS50225_24710 [Betaproteobacteria bacterium]
MFTAKITATSPAQPITAAPVAVKNDTSGDVWVFFGTGQFLQSIDKENIDVQSLYGLIDDDGAKIQRADLAQRAFVVTVGGQSVFANATLGDMDSKRGWFIDFNNHPDDAGERIYSEATVAWMGAAGTVLGVISNVPTKDPCDQGGYHYYNYLNAFTGGNISVPFLDSNHDGEVNDGDLVPDAAGALHTPRRKEKGMSATSLVLGCGKYVLPAQTSDGNLVEEGVDAKGCGGAGIKGRVSWRELIN